ncbi:MAG: alpha-amylase family glycosyl hydrolase, partial [Anaerolineales bacterium]
MNDPRARIVHWLTFLYGKEKAAEVAALIFARVERARTWNKVPSSKEKEAGGGHIGSESGAFTERDAILITYGDQFREPGRPPLQTLRAFLNEHLRDVINGVHILPCFPYSSDDGFAVIDYRRIDPALGDWNDMTAIGRSYRLMLDLVANHVSRQSAWFQAFLRNEAPYKDYFIVVDPAADLSQVVRPRPLPLLTPVATVSGTRYVWTTFSDDQVDLNYA